MAKSDWIAVFDDDDFWLPNHIEALLDFAKAIISTQHIRRQKFLEGLDLKKFMMEPLVH